MNVLVTGGAGFIGAHAAKRLLQEGYRVIVVDNFNDYYDPQLKRSRISELLSGYDLTLYEVDIADLEELREIFQKEDIDLIVHQAAQAGVRYSLEDPFTYERSNIRGTLNILELCKDFNVGRVVFASSSSVYGKRSKVPFREDESTDAPTSLYAATKKSTELLCHSYHALYGIRMTGLRYFTVFGPWGRPDMALFKFTERISKGEPIDIYGDGRVKRDFTYIDDITEGIMRAVRREFDFEIFNLGRGEPSLLLDLIREVERCTEKKAKKEFLFSQKGDVPVTYADISKANRMLDWEPKVSLKEGVERFVEWYEEYARKSP